ncbi:MAG: C_GCAxxG_C_C family protein [bacterium]|nr:C_GCAxxG_C_C family protein [bacterium]
MSHNVRTTDAIGQDKRSPSSLGLQLRTLRNISRMGHCAPVVMQTLMEVEGRADERMVKLVSAMGWGIAGLCSECGAATSPVLMLGLRYGDGLGDDAIPDVIRLGRRYLESFEKRNGSTCCRRILVDDTNPLPCLKAICGAPGIFYDVAHTDEAGAAADAGTLAAHRTLLDAFRDSGFHCAHGVLDALQDVVEVDDAVRRATRGILGGIVLRGQTCGALVGGVLAIGRAVGEIETSTLRCMKMLGMIIFGIDATGEDVNRFNRAVATGGRLVRWFREEFGTSECRELTATDFSDPAAVDRFVAEQGLNRCRTMALAVSRKVREILDAP